MTDDVDVIEFEHKAGKAAMKTLSLSLSKLFKRCFDLPPRESHEAAKT
ncbi:MAG: hypothetical protein AAGF84_06540 [Planctomycetota bacterium]